MLPDHTEERKLAKELGIEYSTLRKRRRQAKRLGKPLVPPWVELGRKFYYPNAETAEWLKSIQQNPVRRRAG
jgi:hypothetical protein